MKKVDFNIRKSKSAMFALVLTAVAGIMLPQSAVNAADVKSCSFSLYYNSPGSANTTAYPEITYYAGTNYFEISRLWGSGASREVLCTGVNVSMKPLPASTECTQQFTCTKIGGIEKAKFKVSMTNSTSGTSYADGKMYID